MHQTPLRNLCTNLLYTDMKGRSRSLPAISRVALGIQVHPISSQNVSCVISPEVLVHIKFKYLTELYRCQVNACLLQSPFSKEHIAINALNRAESNCIVNLLQPAGNLLTNIAAGLSVNSLLDVCSIVSSWACSHLESKGISGLHRAQGNTRLHQASLSQEHITSNALDRAESHTIANLLERAGDPLTRLRLLCGCCVVDVQLLWPLLLVGRRCIAWVPMPISHCSLDVSGMVTLGSSGNLEHQLISYH
mmetsp:Transcript_29597/g.58120  ORF Transcript_29597/g.58120 Transcript_29597/m.58120 type:complete len:249 (-) Transcript_29597:842-1588(-)